jgi:hypothetical protein
MENKVQQGKQERIYSNVKNGCLSAYGVVRFVKIDIRYGDSIHPTLCGLVLGLWVSESSVRCPTKFDL